MEARDKAAREVVDRVEAALETARAEMRSLTSTRANGGGISQLTSAIEVAQDMARRTKVDGRDLRPRTALIAVDVQYDFLPGGALAVEDGDQVIRPLLWAAKDADVVIASADKHPQGHSSFKDNGGVWPTHCVVRTHGSQIQQEIHQVADYEIHKGMDPEREAYSAFDGFVVDDDGRYTGGIAEWLRGKGVERVIVGGLALDFCVKATALDAAQAGFDTVLLLNGTRAVDEATGALALEEMGKAGVHFSTPRPRPSAQRQREAQVARDEADLGPDLGGSPMEVA